MTSQTNPAGENASSVRWRILGLLFLLSMVTYLDRVNISIAARQITSAYNLTDLQMGKVFSAFIFAYALFQVPGGWLGDRFGPRIVIFGAVLWWSVFTAMTALVVHIVPQALIPPVISLIVVRFCLGMGEAAAWPNFNRTIANWMASKERAFATSLPLAGGGLGAAITPPFIAWLMVRYGWQESFYVSAVLGVAIVIVWFWQGRDTPEQHPQVNQAELAEIRGGTQADARASAMGGISGKPSTPWAEIFRTPSVWLLAFSSMACGYLIYIYLTWFYVYLIEVRHLTIMKGSIYAVGPFLAIAIMTPIGGLLSDNLARRLGVRFGRSLVAMGGMFAAGIGVIAGVRISNMPGAILALSLGGGAVYFALSAHWATTIDISKDHAGTVSGFMNWGGNAGGIVSPILTPLLAKRFGWTPALETAAIIILLGGLLWFFVRPDKKISPS